MIHAWAHEINHIADQEITKTHDFDTPAPDRAAERSRASPVPAENVTLTWDQAGSGSYPIGRLTTITGPSGTTKRRYDAQGRMWGEWRKIATAPELYTWWGRDVSGQINQATYPSGRQIVWNRDAMGRVRQIATRKDASSGWVDIANPIAWRPFGGVRSLVFGNGLTATFDVDTDDRISGVRVLPASGAGAQNKSQSWTGDTLDRIVDGLDATRSETFGHSATRRLTSATGQYGAMSWAYDAVGNRASEVSGGTTKSFTTPATSNRLSGVTQGTTTLRSFGYDAAGAIATDAKAGVSWSFVYDAESKQPICATKFSRR